MSERLTHIVFAQVCSHKLYDSTYMSLHQPLVLMKVGLPRNFGSVLSASGSFSVLYTKSAATTSCNTF